MNRTLIAIFLCCSLLAPLAASADDQTVSMSIEKMTCALCPVTVRKAMEGVDGVQNVEVDFETKTATVTFDDVKTSASEVAQASTDVGYPAIVATD